jgi:hypothetical protein
MAEALFIYSANELASHIPPRKEKGKKKNTKKSFDCKVLIVFCDQVNLLTQHTYGGVGMHAGTPQSPSVRAECRR